MSSKTTKRVPNKKANKAKKPNKKANQPKQETEYVTRPILTRFEETEIIARRASQIQGGAPPNLTLEEMAQVPSKPEKIAELELDLRRTPMVLERVLPSGKKELIPIQAIQ